MSGYERTYELTRPLLKGIDFAGAVSRLGLVPLGPERLGVEFLGRPYEITRQGVFPADGKPAQANVLSVLVYYAVSKGGADAENRAEEFALLRYFTGPNFSSDSGGAAGWMTRPLVEAYGSDYPGFSARAEQFGMAYEGSPRNGEHSWGYRVLPRIPLRLAYYEADEEYPCEFKIYYSKRAADFLEFEQLAFLTGCFVHALADADTKPQNQGLNPLR
ncbi:MAG: DUF3786 domain-containing protein [Treponema sp.]|nr:DUF3786 domain-containing protein [Treponema sp.]